jgi:hypothetical protein
VVVGLPADVAFADAGEEEAGDCVLRGGRSTSSPTMAISLFPSVFLKFGFINGLSMFIYPTNIVENNYPKGNNPERLQVYQYYYWLVISLSLP